MSYCSTSFDITVYASIKSIHLLNIINLAIVLPLEKASVSYPECILRAIVHELQAASYITQAAFERGLSMSWWMQTELSRYPQGQSGTCYEECGCHLLNNET